jgi:hypothetical protein
MAEYGTCPTTSPARSARRANVPMPHDGDSRTTMALQSMPAPRAQASNAARSGTGTAAPASLGGALAPALEDMQPVVGNGV